MEKKIINEIYRINELIHGKNSINEARFTPFIDLAKQIYKNLEPELKTFTPELEKIVTKLDNVKFEEDAIGALSELAEKRPDKFDEIYKYVINEVDPKELKVIDDLEKQALSELGKKDLTYDEITRFTDSEIDKQLSNKYQGIKDLFKERIRKTLSGQATDSKIIDKSEKGVVKKIRDVGSTWYTTLDSAGLTASEKAAVAKKFPFKDLRALFGLALKRYAKSRVDGEQKLIEDIFSKLKNFTEGYLDTGGQPNVDLIKDINLSIEAFRKTKEHDLNVVTNEIINVLRTPNPRTGERIPSDIVSKIDDYLKKNNLMEPDQPSWLSDQLEDSSLMNFLDTIGFTKESKTRKISSEIIERIMSFFTTGLLKKWEEYKQLFRNKGFSGGFWYLYAWANLVEKFIVPTIFGIIKTFYQLALYVWGVKDPNDIKPFLERIFDNLMNSIKQNIWPNDDWGFWNYFHLLVPFGFYWTELLGGFDKASEQKVKPIKERIIENGKETIKKVEDEKKKLTTQDSTTVSTPKVDSTVVPATDTTSTIPAQNTGATELEQK